MYRIYHLEREQRIARPLAEVFDFFARAGNLERITPPWLRFQILEEPESVRSGSVISYRLRLHGLPLRWVSVIEEFEPERAFVDRQARGPYRLWHHRHEFAADGEETIVRDRVWYSLPFGLAGALANRLFVRRDLERIFAFRRQAIARLLAAAA
jgi:ligand-binding SRPBCC domain-containing protein